MNFRNLLLEAKAGDPDCISQLFEMYRAMIMGLAKIDGIVDEDLEQELFITLYQCIEKFPL